MPAPTASAATIGAPSGFPSTSHGRINRSLTPSRVGSLRDATTLPSTRARNILATSLSAQRQRGIDVDMRTRNDVHGNDFANSFRRALCGFGGGLDRGDIAPHHRRHVATAGLFVADELDLGR